MASLTVLQSELEEGEISDTPSYNAALDQKPGSALASNHLSSDKSAPLATASKRKRRNKMRSKRARQGSMRKSAQRGKEHVDLDQRDADHAGADENSTSQTQCIGHEQAQANFATSAVNELSPLGAIFGLDVAAMAKATTAAPTSTLAEQHQPLPAQNGTGPAATQPPKKTKRQKSRQKQPANSESTQDQSHKKKPKIGKDTATHERAKPGKICDFWIRYNCSNGSSCKFLHVGPGGESRTSQLCRFFKSGSCIQGTQCPFSHDLKLEPCVFFHFGQDKGGCRQGHDCPFSHDPMTEVQRLKLEKDQTRWEERVQKNMKRGDSNQEDVSFGQGAGPAHEPPPQLLLLQPSTLVPPRDPLDEIR